MEDSDYVLFGIVITLIFILVMSGMFLGAKQKCVERVKDKPAAEIHLICGS